MRRFRIKYLEQRKYSRLSAIESFTIEDGKEPIEKDIFLWMIFCRSASSKLFMANFEEASESLCDGSEDVDLIRIYGKIYGTVSKRRPGTQDH